MRRVLAAAVGVVVLSAVLLAQARNIQWFTQSGPAANIAVPITQANGGTGVSTAAANTVFAGPASGGPAAPTFRALATINGISTDTRLTTDQVLSTTTLVVMTGTSQTVTAGQSYKFEILVFFNNVDGVGGVKFGCSGTATMTAFQGSMLRTNEATNGVTGALIAYNGASGDTGAGAYEVLYSGTMTINAGGTFQAQVAQSIANGTSTVKAGSRVSLTPIS